MNLRLFPRKVYCMLITINMKSDIAFVAINNNFIIASRAYFLQIHFPRKQPQVHSINSIGKFSTITIGGFEFPLPTVKKKYDILIIGDVHIPVEVT